MSESLVIASFKYGLEARRDQLVSQPGTLASLINAHINDGGEVEKRQAFVDATGGTVSFANTFGLLCINDPAGAYQNSGIVVFCDYSTILPVGFNSYPSFSYYTTTKWSLGYTAFKCRHPKGAFGGADDITMTGVQWAVAYNGFPLVCATFSDGNAFLYYGGSSVPHNPIDASAMGLVYPTLTAGSNLADQLAGFVNGANGPGLTDWIACTYVTGATVAAGGTGYQVNDILTVFGGTVRTGSAAATFKVTGVSGTVITTIAVQIAGAYTAHPNNNPNPVTGGHGTGASLTLTFSNYTDIFTPPGNNAVTYSTATTNDPTQTVSVQHMQGARTGSSGTSASASLCITAPGVTGDVWTASVETTPSGGSYTQVGQYIQQVGDTTVLIAQGIADAINATNAAINVSATSDTAANVTVYGAQGDTSFNGTGGINRRLQISTPGTGTIGAATQNYASIFPSIATGTKIGVSGRFYNVFSNTVTVTTNITSPTYAWSYVSGDTSIYASNTNQSANAFGANNLIVNQSLTAIWKCVVTSGANTATATVAISLSVESNA